MYLERYPYTTISHGGKVRYECISVGPKGAVKKVIVFDKVGTNMYNLAFGDAISESGSFTDKITTDNKDLDKVLATVAMTVMSFTEDHPDAIIYAEGSTPARTRLYRICITKHWQGITNHFQISGITDYNWEKFKKDKSYRGFLGKRIEISNFENIN